MWFSLLIFYLMWRSSFICKHKKKKLSAGTRKKVHKNTWKSLLVAIIKEILDHLNKYYMETEWENTIIIWSWVKWETKSEYINFSSKNVVTIDCDRLNLSHLYRAIDFEWIQSVEHFHAGDQGYLSRNEPLSGMKRKIQGKKLGKDHDLG